MIDIFALSVTHGLLALAAFRLLSRDELDSEGAARPRFGARRKIGDDEAGQDERP